MLSGLIRKTTLAIAFMSYGSTVIAQDAKAAGELVSQGVECHDKKDYDCAIEKYDKALELDKNNVYAMAEKALTLSAEKKYDEVIKLCKKNLSVNKGSDGLGTVYVTYANALDVTGDTEKALEVYNEGIELFADNYQLHYNKGIMLVRQKRYNEALKSFQHSVRINPRHASSQSAMGWILDYNNKKIPAMMVYCRFLALEPQGERAKEILAALIKLVNGNVAKTGKNSISISIDKDVMADSGKANNFGSVELVLSMSAAMDYDEKNARKKPVELFAGKLQTVCAVLSETKKDNRGFYWNYYAPYFIEMHKKDLLTAFSYIAFSSSEDPDVIAWLKAHKDATDRFFRWSGAYDWNAE